jgi:hypothetical protein
MKRAVVTMLVVSLFAVPMFAQDPVAKARCVSLEHVSGAWHMQISCENGAGSISLSEASENATYRGDGVFATWSQQELRAMYESLVPKDTESAIEVLQLG